MRIDRPNDHLAENLHDWPDDALRAAIRDGLDSGAPTPLEMDVITRQARQPWNQDCEG